MALSKCKVLRTLHSGARVLANSMVTFSRWVDSRSGWVDSYKFESAHFVPRGMRIFY